MQFSYVKTVDALVDAYLVEPYEGQLHLRTVFSASDEVNPNDHQLNHQLL